LAQVFPSSCIFFGAAMGVRYDRELMTRGEAARRLITEGEDPFRMLLTVVWPDHDWEASVLLARLKACPRCSDGTVSCEECGNTGLVTAARHQLLTLEALAAYAYDAA
jgi:hypothetical protein